MAQIQFGWSMPSGVRDKSQQGIYVSRLQEGLELVAGHFASAWFVDHFQYDDAMLMEGWTALTYLSALQPHLKFGHAVLSQSFRNPALLAKMAATLQFMSGGR